MQVATVQLSDIHIKTSRDPVLVRAMSICEAVYATVPHVSACVVLISGDIAYSGHQSQYDAAYNFFEELRNGLMTLPAVETVEFIAIPGNHDCDFDGESDTRTFVLRDLTSLYESDLNLDAF